VVGIRVKNRTRVKVAFRVRVAFTFPVLSIQVLTANYLCIPDI